MKTTPPPETEEEFLQCVLDLALAKRWLRAHFRPARTARGWRTAVQGDGKGFPDLILVRERVVFAELKAEGGRATPEQGAWLEALARAGAEAYIWRPSDWQEILDTLD